MSCGSSIRVLSFENTAKNLVSSCPMAIANVLIRVYTTFRYPIRLCISLASRCELLIQAQQLTTIQAQDNEIARFFLTRQMPARTQSSSTLS